MLSIEEALAKIIEHAGRQAATKINLEDALGLTLAEAVHADFDSPPFTKSMMDGFAIRGADLPAGKGSLKRIGEVSAGQSSSRTVEAGQAIQIMTGAPLPVGADSVVMVERTKLAGDVVTIDDAEFATGQNVFAQGSEYTKGEEVLSSGAMIGPAEMGLLASVGVVRPTVYRAPRIAILSTGDEIVPAHEKPGPNQIRNSNEWTLAALAKQAGAVVERLGIASDDERDLKEKIRKGLEADVLLLSGGVSAGKRDLVPRILEELSVIEIFHGINFKPGKPMWFGKRLDSIVFGLPGNPVSVLACFEVFVRTALNVRQGNLSPKPQMMSLPLRSDIIYPTRRVTYHPARIVSSPTGPIIEPAAWQGSADLRGLTKANALVVFPIGDGIHRAGDKLSVLPLSGRGG